MSKLDIFGFPWALSDLNLSEDQTRCAVVLEGLINRQTWNTDLVIPGKRRGTLIDGGTNLTLLQHADLHPVAQCSHLSALISRREREAVQQEQSWGNRITHLGNSNLSLPLCLLLWLPLSSNDIA